MILKSIELNNFRLFYGNQKLEFKENDFNVIVGNNATGKSSIIEAIKWCIYGEGNSSILNFKAAQKNDEKTLFVKCDFKEGDDDIVMIRSIIFDENNNVVNNKFKSFLNDVKFKDTPYYIEDYFLKEFYDFIENSFEQENNSLKHIIPNKNGINDLAKVLNHLRKLQNKNIHELNQFNPIPIEDSIIRIEKRLNDVSMRYEKNDMDIKQVSYELDKINKSFYDFPDIRNKFRQKDKLTKELYDANIEIRHNEDELSLILIKNLPLLLVNSHNSNIGSSLDFEEIEKYLYQYASEGDELVKYHKLKDHLENLQDINEIKMAVNENRMLKDKIEKISSEIKNIESELTLYGNSLEKIELKNELTKRHEMLLREKGKLTHEKKTLMNELKRLSQENILITDISDIKIKMDFINKCISSIEKLMDELNNKSRKDLKNSINKYFLENSSLDYDEVLVDESYNISIVKSGFKINSQDLSNAERELLKIALILSVYDLSDNTFPLIFDTPFMRLDVNGRESIKNMLKNTNYQKIFLLNAFEADNMPKDYELKLSDDMGVIVHGE